MKKSICLAVSLLALNLTPGFGQPAAPQNSTTFAQRLAAIQQANAANAPVLTKFNLDFPGGTPAQLVKAIEKATGKPLNVIIPDEAADTKLPPVRVSGMDVGTLFKTISENGKKYLPYKPGHDNEYLSNYGFTTIDTNPSDNSLWTFYAYTRPTFQTQFSLDFPGGTPSQLVKAIEKATGRPLNTIIPIEDADLQLPPLKLNDVFVPQLFAALSAASQKTVTIGFPGRNDYGTYGFGYGFKSGDDGSDNIVWYFHVEKPTVPPPIQKVSQFYSLAPYLNNGFTVDDITTAIQTGWKMAGDASPPELNYHKETGLLIAFGEPSKLKTINDVLQTLPQLKSVYWQQMNKSIYQLQQQVKELQAKVSAPPTNASATEKTGK